MIRALSAVTLATADMERAVRFYERLGFERLHGGEAAEFTTFAAGASFLNLVFHPGTPVRRVGWWGRAIFHVDDVDEIHAHALRLGLQPHDVPRDGPWGERYFHLTDPDGNELSFARPLEGGRAAPPPRA
jgi:catechol 2,3-dioxygenase-like lactoylglutathione lyase family enzyme